MIKTPAQEAIAYLIDQAQQGKIDPWDVQVIEVIDRFFSELGLMGETESSQQNADLPQSGQAFLWASMLVLLKADTLEKTATPEPEEAELIAAEAIAVPSQRSLPKHLEHQLRRRSAAPPVRRRRVTLQELIEQIQQIASELESGGGQRTRSLNARSQSRREAARAITQLAHNENLTQVASQLEKFFLFDLPQLAPGETSIDLDRLLGWWTESTINSDRLHHSPNHSPSGDRVGVFWALLLLCAQSKVELSQTEFYQDLKIRPLAERGQD
ncbi:MAG: segregation/condensation protein A [Prochloraceae cyanobacterium]